MEETIQVAIEAAKMLMKDVMFKKARDFSDVFKKARVLPKYEEVSGRRYHSWPLVEGGHCHLMRLCTVRWDAGNVTWLDVEPHDIVLANVHASMLMAKDYQLFFEIIVRADNTALVTVKYDSILGDRWVAIIDCNTIPSSGEVSAVDTSDRGVRPATTRSDALIQTLLHRLSMIYGGPARPKPGKYIALGPSCFVERLVKVSLPFQAGGGEYVWVEVTKEIDENGNQLAGKLVNQPSQATGFNAGDSVGLRVEEIEDVSSPSANATNTSVEYIDQLGPDNIHIFTRDLDMQVAYADAVEAWFAMSDIEKEWIARIFKRRSKELQVKEYTRDDS